MPYKIEKRDRKWCVVRADTGANKGCSDTKEEAQAHMNALHAAENKANAMDDCMKQHMADMKKKNPDMSEADMTAAARAACSKSDKTVDDKSMGMMMLTQAETNYGAANGTTGKACSTCRWFCPAGDMEEAHCHLVMDYPAPISPNGLCDRWETVPAMNTEPDPIPVVIVEPDDSAEMALPTNRKGLIEVITDTVKRLLQAPAQDMPEPAFSVFKAADGKHYWLARHTGKFKDREGEIITDKAHEEYVSRVQKGIVPLPELWTWHTKGTRHGQADVVWKSGGFILALGHFDDTAEAKHAIAFYEKNAGKIKLSHMFTYPHSAKQGGVYHAYNTVEITTLPDGAEAFPYTSFEEIRSMTLPSEQREWIRGVGGDDMLKRVDTADAKAADDTKALEANGIEHKNLDNFEGATIPAPKADVEALKVVQTDIEMRLKMVETMPEQITNILDTLTAYNKSVKALADQVAASQAAELSALEKVNALEKQLLEYTALKAPASQSNDTVLNAREKSLLDTMMTEAKTLDTVSVVDKMVGGQPTVATGASI